MSTNTPTIKGIFVKSHINGVLKEKGEEGVRLLEQKYGKPLVFKNSDNVPLRDEVRLLECAVEILRGQILPPDQLAFESGRLHFKNFLTTPIAKILFPFFKNQFKLMMLQAQNIAGHIFEGVEFHSKELAEKRVTLSMKNNDYPIEHFQGFLQEWLDYSDLHGSVDATKTDNTYLYTIHWE